MIFIGVGGNLLSPRTGAPIRTAAVALRRLCDGRQVRLVRCSRWYWSTPVPASDQPLFGNAVVHVASHLAPADLLQRLLAVEAGLGRIRGVRNGPRLIDLDLLAYGARIVGGEGDRLVLPHPRMTERAFVMVPLAELAANWRHPRTGESARDTAAALLAGRSRRPLWPAVGMALGSG